MRICRDVELVESLGSGIPRILRVYGEDCFKFTDNFIRIIFPINNHYCASDHDGAHIHKQIKVLVDSIEGEMDRETIQSILGIKHRTYFRNKYLRPAFDDGYIEFTHPNEKQSKSQKYRLPPKGLQLKEKLKKQNKK